MPILHVRDVPEDLHQRIQALARGRKRSIRAEVIALLDSAVTEAELRKDQGRILEEIRRTRFTPKVKVPESHVLLREDRDR
jgi:hypothetical protein